MARDCSSYNFVRTDLCREKEKTEKMNSTNSHEAHGKKIPRTHTLKFPKTSARTE